MSYAVAQFAVDLVAVAEGGLEVVAERVCHERKVGWLKSESASGDSPVLPSVFFFLTVSAGPIHLETAT